MNTLEIKKAHRCRWDLVSLGEVMIRLDPGEGRIRAARNFAVWEGGGEYNVARALRKCFRMRTAVLTGMVRSEVGYLLEDLVMQGGVDASHAKWFDYDGVGRAARVPLNFTERGYGMRAALGCSDRGHSAASQLRRGDFDLELLFDAEGARWLHTGGIFAALSEGTADLAVEVMDRARLAGTVVSYDLNYRPSLWEASGGREKARRVNAELVAKADVLFGCEEDFGAALGYKVEGLDQDFSRLDAEAFGRTMRSLLADFPNLKAVAVTLRNVKTATANDWGALLLAGGALYRSAMREDVEVLDRVGGGDSFASGLVFGLLDGRGWEESLELGAAHGLLAMTTPGDASMASREEVERLARHGNARIIR